MAEVDYQKLYLQIGRLLETTPDMSNLDLLRSPAAQQWLGRAYALVEAVDVGTDKWSFIMLTAGPLFRVSSWESSLTEIYTHLYRALAYCELRSPAASAGTFVPVGNAFDAFTAISKLLQAATVDVMVVDPYLDETALTEFGLAVPLGVRFRLLADESAHKATLVPAATKWIVQHGTNRPLEVRLAPQKTLHDRAIFVDRSSAWTLTQSLKDFAKRSPAEIVKADSTAALKIGAYEAIWATSRVVG